MPIFQSYFKVNSKLNLFKHVLKKKIFFEAIKRYFPLIEENRLYADYCGIRPKLQGPLDGFKDFVISDGAMHGFSGLVQLFGIESPGLTSSLAIAEKVNKLVL